MKPILRLITVWAVTAAANAAELEQGRYVYETAGGYGCIVCHGHAAHGAGQAGGYIRGLDSQAILNSLESIPSMMPLKTALSPQQIEALGVYLRSLSDIPLITMNYDGEQWHGVYEPLTDANLVEIVFYNDSFNTALVELTNGEPPKSVPPLASWIYQQTVEKPSIDLMWLVQLSDSWQPANRLTQSTP